MAHNVGQPECLAISGQPSRREPARIHGRDLPAQRAEGPERSIGLGTPPRIIRTQAQDALTAIARLRYEVYVREHGRLVDVADHGREELRDADDITATHFALLDERGHAMAAIRVHVGHLSPAIASPLRLRESFPSLDEARICVASKFIVAPRLRRGTAAVRMLVACYQHASDRNIDALFCTTFPQLLELYARVGLRPYLPEYIDPHLGPHYALMGFLNGAPSVMTRLVARGRREGWTTTR